MESTEKRSFTTKATDVIIKSRKAILVVIIAAILFAIVATIIVVVKNAAVKEGLSQLDSLEFKYESLLESSDTFSEERLEILSDAKKLADESNSVVKVRSSLLVASINFEIENWQDARDAYITAFDADTNAYTAPLSLYNAAICSEELNELDLAIQYFDQAVEYEDFSLSARAMFNAARIEDTRGNYQQAYDRYVSINDKHATSEWASVSMSRAIALRAENKAQ